MAAAAGKPVTSVVTAAVVIAVIVVVRPWAVVVRHVQREALVSEAGCVRVAEHIHVLLTVYAVQSAASWV